MDGMVSFERHEFPLLYTGMVVNLIVLNLETIRCVSKWVIPQVSPNIFFYT